MDVEANINKRKHRRKQQKLLIIDLLFDFAKNTSLHGLRYAAQAGLTVVEKIFWIFTFTASLVLCFVFIRQVWLKWRHSPVIVTFNEEMISVGEILFPSVTVCPQWKCAKHRYNYLEQIKKNNIWTHESFKWDPKEMEQLENAMLICDDAEIFIESPLNRTKSDKSVVDSLKMISPTLDEVFYQCRWRGETYDCSAMFKRVLTSEGVCFNFNAMSYDQILRNDSVQREYAYMDPNPSFSDYYKSMFTPDDGALGQPLQGRETGSDPDLDFVLQEHLKNNDEMCNSLSNGFKVFIQHPSDMPQSSQYFYAAIAGQSTSVALKATILNTSENLKDYKVDLRQCYFPEDRKLKYFNTYSPDNCRLECLSLYTSKRCGCVWFHMPHDNSSEICTIASRSCIKNAHDEFASIKFIKGKPSKCNCMPSCDSIRYDAEILKTNFDLQKHARAFMKWTQFNGSSWIDGYKHSRVLMYFRDPSFVSMRRSELFGVKEFLANCGGLLGLFLGFSFLSLVEIFYFFTMRLCCVLRKDTKAEKQAIN